MLTKSILKKYSSLRQKKFREEFGLFTAEGEKIVNELLEDPGILKIKTLIATPDFLKKRKENVPGTEILATSQNELDRISSLKNSNGAILIIEIPVFLLEPEEVGNSFSFFFENIQDPGNLGSIIRTCDWFGIRNIFLSPGSVDIFNPKVIQASMGSIARVKIHYIHPEELISQFKLLSTDFQYIATIMDGDDIYRENPGTRGIVFFGNESKGLSRNIIKKCSQRISIPRHPGNEKPDSLNLSIAAGIIGSELMRRKIIQNGN